MNPLIHLSIYSSIDRLVQHFGGLHHEVVAELGGADVARARRPGVAGDGDGRDGAERQFPRRFGARRAIQAAAVHPAYEAGEVLQNAVPGQYGPARIGGEDVPGFRQEPGVDPNRRPIRTRR